MKKIISLSVGKPESYLWKGKEEESGIGKKVVNEVQLTKEGFVGDGVANLEFHGGFERAVCVYPYEHYSMWNSEFATNIIPPAMGENLCVTNMLEKDVFIGDTYSIGEVVVQVTQGRVPCSTISKFNHIDKLLPRIVETGFTGYFLKVLQEGTIYADSKIKLIDRTQEEVSVLYANQILFHDRKNRQAIEKILAIPALAAAWRETFEKALEKSV